MRYQRLRAADQALATMPLDPLQTWLARHVLCGGEADTIAIERAASREDGSREVLARCEWCGTSTSIVVGAGPLPVFTWWASLLAHIVVDYQAVLLPGGWVNRDGFSSVPPSHPIGDPALRPTERCRTGEHHPLMVLCRWRCSTADGARS
jgi:hypothetical protein